MLSHICDHVIANQYIAQIIDSGIVYSDKSKMDIVLGIIAGIFSVAYFASCAGLYFFKRWAISTYLVSIVVILFYMVFQPVMVMGSIPYFLTQLATLSTGAFILVLVMGLIPDEFGTKT